MIKKTLREEFPLRGYLECRKCGKKLTGSSSKGNGGLYFYYHCTKGCNERFKAEEANSAFLRKLASFIHNENSIEFLEVLIKNSNAPSSEKEIQKKAIVADIDKFKNRIRNIQEQLADKEISAADYNEMRFRYEREINWLERESEKLKSRGSDFADQVEFCVDLVRNLPTYYDSADLIGKQQIIGSIFLEKLVFENNAVRTKKVNDTGELICRQGKGLRKIEKKESSEFSELSNLVPGTGFEPVSLRDQPLTK